MNEHSPIFPRQTRRYAEKREAILDAAARLFNQKGVKGATLSDVAKSVGLITNSVTYYYRKKEDLAAACFLRTIHLLDALAATANRAPTPEARVREFLRSYFHVRAEIASGERPELVSFNDIRALTSPHAEIVFDAYTDMFRKVRSLLHARGAPALARIEENARAHLLLSLTLCARAWVERYEPGDYARAAERFIDLLINGLASPSATWNPLPLPELVWSSSSEADVTPEAFLRAATYLVNEQGYRGASVDKISARLNVTKGSFYHHNDNKDDLIGDCFKRSFAVIRRVQTIAEQRGRTGWDHLSIAASALVRYQLSDHGPLLRSTAWSALPEVLREDMMTTMNRLSERFASVIVDGMADGSIRPLDPSIAAQMVNGMVNAAAELERWVPGVTIDTASYLYARPLFVGLLKSGR